MKVSILLSIYLLLSITLFGQLAADTTYYTKNHEICEKEGSNYYTVSRNNCNKIDTVYTYYSANNRIRSWSQINEAGVAHGEFTYFHPNGNIKTTGRKESYLPVGNVVSYYPDGKLQCVEVFTLETSTVLEYFDSTGIQIIKNKNGYCRCILDNHKWNTTIEFGKLINGKKDSTWTGISDAFTFTEFYDNGKLISGFSVDSEKLRNEYDQIETIATPVNGLQGAYQSIAQNLKYPREARRRGIEGKVFIQFIIEQDGSLTNIECIKGIGGGCETEAIRVIKALPKWIPGRQRGRLVRQRMVLPLTFKLH